MDDDAILTFVMSYLPEKWDKTTEYTRSWNLIPLSTQSVDYQIVESYFYGAHISLIQRVQNPFQFGRYMIRREMTQTTYEDIVFHVVHRDDLETALKFNCDYRRYQRRHEGLYEDHKHPKFYHSFKDLINVNNHSMSDIRVLVLKILTNEPKTQCDYYIEYVVTF
ncbi:Hypothetical protein CINCED_3A009403 [Cinara cedri]|nr:Hypothetical protein CINCED_3A009403 [Cinara cedri]